MEFELESWAQADCLSPVGSEKAKNEGTENETDRQARLKRSNSRLRNRGTDMLRLVSVRGVSSEWEIPQSGLFPVDHGLLQALYWRCSLGQ